MSAAVEARRVAREAERERLESNLARALHDLHRSGLGGARPSGNHDLEVAVREAKLAWVAYAGERYQALYDSARSTRSPNGLTPAERAELTVKLRQEYAVKLARQLTERGLPISQRTRALLLEAEVIPPPEQLTLL